MHFFIDESGDFKIPQDPNDHHASIVSCIIVTDTILESLKNEFEKFCSSLDGSECINGEPKGYRLTYEHRIELSELLFQITGVYIIPVTLDLSLIAYCQGKTPLRESMYEYLYEYSEKMIHMAARDDLRLKARQFRNLSDQQTFRIFTIAKCIDDALRYAITYLSASEFQDSWNSISIEIDRTTVQPQSREEIIMSFMIPGWIDGWSRKKPFIVVKEIHTDEHPFIKNYGIDEGIDGGKLVTENLT